MIVLYPEVWLTTLDAVEEYLKLTFVDPALLTDPDDQKQHQEAETLKRANLIRAIRQASADVIAYLNRLPVPHIMTMRYPSNPRTRYLAPEGELLEVISADGIDPDRLDFEPYNRYPKEWIVLSGGAGACGCGCGNSNGGGGGGVSWRSFEITGWFGFVPQWDYAFQPVGVLLPDTEMSAEMLAIPVVDVAPYQIGEYLRIDDEMMQIIGKQAADPPDAPAPMLLLARGLFGTVATAHADGTTIYRFRQLDVIQTNVTEWAAFLEKSRGRVGERIQIAEDGSKIVNDLSPLIKQALAPYRRL